MTTIPTVDYFQHPFGNPDLADGWGSTGYWEGGRYVPRAHPHRGLDYPQPEGATITAAATGEVVAVFWSSELGNVTVIKHNRGALKPSVFTGYCHQSKTSVKRGQIVKRGQPIGQVGATGTAAAGPHLHFTAAHTVGGVTGPSPTFNPALFIEHNSKTALAPKPVVTVVRDGQSLSSIAAAYGLTLAKIEALNPQIVDVDLIRIGDHVRVK